MNPTDIIRAAIVKLKETDAKMTRGDWGVLEKGLSRKNPNPTVFATDSDLRYIAFCADYLTVGEPTPNLENAKGIAALRNGLPSYIVALEVAVLILDRIWDKDSEHNDDLSAARMLACDAIHAIAGHLCKADKTL